MNLSKKEKKNNDELYSIQIKSNVDSIEIAVNTGLCSPYYILWGLLSCLGVAMAKFQSSVASPARSQSLLRIDTKHNTSSQGRPSSSLHRSSHKISTESSQIFSSISLPMNNCPPCLSRRR